MPLSGTLWRPFLHHAKSFLSTGPGLDVLEEIHSHVKKLTRAYPFRQIGSDNVDLPDDKKAVKRVQRLMRDATRVVRNWGYFSQVKRIVRELYSPFDAKLLETRGFSVSDAINVFDTILSTAESRMTTHHQTFVDLFRRSSTDRRLLVKNYHLLIGSDKEEVDRCIQKFNVRNFSRKDACSIIISHYDYLQLSHLHIFSSSNLAQSLDLAEDQVSSILDEYALNWGVLSECNTEDFHLSNPVWTKPVIKLGGGQYFCALPVGFFRFAIPCIESLLSPFGDAVSERRAEYLEAKVAEIVKTRFSGSRMKRNFKWIDGDKTYETDLIVFVDSFALIIECKSGKVTPPALRGAPDRLRRRIQKLLIDPNLQSLRLKERLECLSSNPNEVDPIRNEIGYDLNKLHKVVRASVCLEDFGPIQSCLPQLKDTHWLPADFEPCPTMNLADFEMIFDILEHPIQILHYLMKREMIEASFNYHGYEKNLLGWYLTTLLDIGDVEHDAKIIVNGTSSSLESYYDSADAGVNLSKPQPAISSLFASIFSQLEQRGIDRWTEIGIALNMFSPDYQIKITEELTKLEKKVHRNWRMKGHDNLLILIPPKASSYALGYVMFKNGNAGDKRNFINDAVNQAFQPNHVQTVIIIAKNIDKKDNLGHI